MESSPLTVLQILPDLNAGGVERTTVEAVEALVNAGHRAHVLSAGGHMVKQIEALGGVHHTQNIGSKNILSLPWRIAGLRRLIAEHKVDIVHARSRAPAWPAMLAARAENVPFVTTYHGIYNSKSGLKTIYNSVMAKGDHIIANSRFTRDHILKMHGTDPAQITVIYRGVDMAQFTPLTQEQRAIAKAEIGMKAEDVSILLPGRLTRWKGQLVAVEALSHLPEDHHLYLMGDPQGREAYVAEIETLAARLGVIDRLHIRAHSHDIASVMGAADIVISASTDPEAFGRVMAEAQAMGRPVVASAHGGALETVLDGESGILVEVGSPKSLVRGITQARALDTEVLAQARRARIGQEFSKTALQTQLLEVYRTVTGRKSPET